MRFNCIPQTLSKLAMALVFTVLGMGAVVVGLTILPFIGLLIAVPFFSLAFYFFRAHLNRQCEISN